MKLFLVLNIAAAFFSVATALSGFPPIPKNIDPNIIPPPYSAGLCVTGGTDCKGAAYAITSFPAPPSKITMECASFLTKVNVTEVCTEANCPEHSCKKIKYKPGQCVTAPPGKAVECVVTVP